MQLIKQMTRTWSSKYKLQQGITKRDCSETGNAFCLMVRSLFLAEAGKITLFTLLILAVPEVQWSMK